MHDGIVAASVLHSAVLPPPGPLRYRPSGLTAMSPLTTSIALGNLADPTG